jgi:hypothetical protein
MDYLIYGTGSGANIFIDNLWVGYFKREEHSIIAFVDSDMSKTGKVFSMGWKIISPSMIKNYHFDKIIICSSYEKEIMESLIQEQKIDREYIMTQNDIYDELSYDLVENKSICDKNILVIGNKERYCQLKNYYTELLNVVC